VRVLDLVVAVDLLRDDLGVVVVLVLRGAELAELEPEDQAPNAVSDERGTLALAD
jgi:hypothetical protein